MTNTYALNHTLARTRLSSDVDCAECADVSDEGCWWCTARMKGVLRA